MERPPLSIPTMFYSERTTHTHTHLHEELYVFTRAGCLAWEKKMFFLRLFASTGCAMALALPLSLALHALPHTGAGRVGGLDYVS